MVKQIRLTQGKVALVDDIDYYIVMQHKWHAYRVQRAHRDNDFHARTTIRNEDHKIVSLRMHNLVIEIAGASDVHISPGFSHIDGDGLNNQRSNLRAITRAPVVERPVKIMNTVRSIHIYFVQCQSTRLIKIGIARDVLARLRDLQGSSSTALIMLASTPGSRKAEFTLHERFRFAHVRGEWFTPVPELMELIRDYAKEPSLRKFMSSSPNRRIMHALMTATGLSEHSCKRAIDAGQLPGYKIGREYVVSEFELTAWCQGRWRPSVRDDQT